MSAASFLVGSTEYGNLRHRFVRGRYFKPGKAVCGAATKIVVPAELDAPWCVTCKTAGLERGR
jgi:hypothetical protein